MTKKEEYLKPIISLSIDSLSLDVIRTSGEVDQNKVDNTLDNPSMNVIR